MQKKRGRPRKTEKAPQPFSVSLTMGNDTYRGHGNTQYDALLSLKKPDKIMAKGILVTMHGDALRKTAVSPFQIKQLFFTSKPLLEVKAKQLFMNL